MEKSFTVTTRIPSVTTFFCPHIRNKGRWIYRITASPEIRHATSLVKNRTTTTQNRMCSEHLKRASVSSRKRTRLVLYETAKFLFIRRPVRPCCCSRMMTFSISATIAQIVYCPSSTNFSVDSLQKGLPEHWTKDCHVSK